MMHKTNSNRWMMTKVVVLPALMALAVVAFAKPKVESIPVTEESTEPTIANITTPPEVNTEVSLPANNDSIYVKVEKDAVFPGGEAAMFKWIADHIKYPEECKAKGIQGRVYVQFVVNKDGSLSDAKILRSPDKALSQEAIRVVKAMPKWKPAQNKGKVVRSYFRLPIIFKLPGTQKTETITGQGTQPKPVEETADNEIYDNPVTEAEFPGGMQAEFKWIADHLKDPEECKAKEIQGNVYVQFVVNEDGSLSDAKILRSPDKALSQEAVRVVKAMPKWKPAKQGEKAVRSYFRLPIVFKLPPAQTEQKPKE